MDGRDWVTAGLRVADTARSLGAGMMFVEVILSPNETSPRFVTFLYLPDRDTRFGTAHALESDFALALGERDVRVRKQGAHIAVEVTRDVPYSLSYEKIVPRLGLKPWQLYLGRSGAGEELVANINSPEACHIMIAGITGSGKTTLAQSMIASMCQYTRPRDAQLILLDPKRDDSFASHVANHVNTHATTLAECRDALRRIVVRMKQPGRLSCQVVVYCDEANELVAEGGSEVTEDLQHIANMGRGLGVHLLLCGQHTKANQFPPIVKANIPLRIIGLVGSAQAAANMAGVSRVGAERLGGRGDFMAVWSGGKDERFQAPAFRPHLPGVVAKLAPPASPAPEPPRPERDADGDRLVSLIAKVLAESPNPDEMSSDEISRRVAGHRVRGTAYKARFDAALARARARDS